MERIILTLLIVLSVFTSLGQGMPKAVVDINQQHLGVDAAGSLGFDIFEPNWMIQNSHEVPAGNGTEALFAGTLWMGGIANGHVHVAADRFRQNTISWLPGPAMQDQSTYVAEAYKWDRVWKISKAQITYHIEHHNDATYIMDEVIENWPAHGDVGLGQSANLAKFMDVNGNGVYDPENGDYPAIRGDQAVLFIMNDDRIDTSMALEKLGESALKSEVIGMLYGFDCPSSTVLDHALFLEYTIKNRSNNTYDETFVGQWIDFDLGNAQDDYMACDVLTSTFYVRNGDAEDQDAGSSHGYGTNLGIFGVTFLKGAPMAIDGIDNSIGIEDGERPNGLGFGDGIKDNEYMGLERFCFHNNSSGPTGYPATTSDYYRFLSGKWKDGSLMMYGGNGYESPNPPSNALQAKYMYPGESDPLFYGTGGVNPVDSGHIPSWTERTAGNQPGDRRGMGSTGPFTFAPEASIVIDLALVFARGRYGYDSLELMDAVQEIRDVYTSGTTECGHLWPTGGVANLTDDEIVSFPNPTHGKIHLRNANAQTKWTVIGLTGQALFKGVGSEIDLSKLPKGGYMIETFHQGSQDRFLQITQ